MSRLYASELNCPLRTASATGQPSHAGQNVRAQAVGPDRVAAGTWMSAIDGHAQRRGRFWLPVCMMRTHCTGSIAARVSFICRAQRPMNQRSGCGSARQACMGGTALCTSNAGPKRWAISAARRSRQIAHRSGLSKPVASLAPIESTTMSRRAQGAASSSSIKPGESSPLAASTGQYTV